MIDRAAAGHDFEPYQWEKERCGYIDENDMMCGYRQNRHFNTANDFLVGSQNLQTVIIAGLQTQYPMDSAKAFRLAAWLVSVAEVNYKSGPTFEETLAAVRGL